MTPKLVVLQSQKKLQVLERKSFLKKSSSSQTFVLMRTSGRRLLSSSSEDVLQNLQDVFKTYHQVKLFAQVTLLRNLCSVQKICKCDENFSNFSITPQFQFFTLLHLLVAAYRGVFRTCLIIYKGAFFVKILNVFKMLMSQVLTLRIDQRGFINIDVYYK